MEDFFLGGAGIGRVGHPTRAKLVKFRRKKGKSDSATCGFYSDRQNPPGGAIGIEERML
jgi:hypothetical protein